MKSGAMVFLASFLALAASWGGFVLAPQIQLGRAVQERETGSETLYPLARSGLAAKGAEIYRANGCVYCHSQQLRQDGTRVEVVLTEIGTNATALAAALSKLNVPSQGGSLQPGKIADVADVPAASVIAAEIKKVGGKAESKVVPTGVDISRWGYRGSVAADYLYDSTVQPGTRRVGDDLTNVGARRADANWHYVHLYTPRAVVTGSTMPAYRFMFETRKIGREKSPDALVLPKEFAPAEGFEVVPKEEARLLVAYLMSLRADAPLFEAPITVARVPAATTATTNSPAK